jgi:acetone carboxylase, gamma subunit
MEQKTDERFPLDHLRLLVEGKLPWENTKKAMHLRPKDTDRFWKYLEVLQERVPWKDKILLRISDHLYIVAKPDSRRVVKCDCGQELGDYRINWKLSCRIRVRNTIEEMREVFTIEEGLPDPSKVEAREYYCPGCLSQVAVELVPLGYPPLIEMLPDLDTFYRDWLGKPLPDERPDWFQDRTVEAPARWVKEG